MLHMKAVKAENMPHSNLCSPESDLMFVQHQILNGNPRAPFPVFLQSKGDENVLNTQIAAHKGQSDEDNCSLLLSTDNKSLTK